MSAPDPDPSLESPAPRILRHRDLAGLALGPNSGILGLLLPRPSQARQSQPGNPISLGQPLQLPVFLLPPAGISGADGFTAVFLGCNNPQNYIGSFPPFSFFFPNFVSCPNRKTKQSQEGSPSGGAVGRATIFRSFPAVFSGCGHDRLDLRRSGSSLENPFFHGKSTLLPHRNTGPDPSLG